MTGKRSCCAAGSCSAIRLSICSKSTPLVRRVLVDEHEALGTFRDQVEILHAAEHAQAEPVGDERLGAAGRDLTLDFKRQII